MASDQLRCIERIPTKLLAFVACLVALLIFCASPVIAVADEPMAGDGATTSTTATTADVSLVHEECDHGDEDRLVAMADQIVYITRTGSKFHLAGCKYLSRSQIPISYSDAVARGYDSCSVCMSGSAGYSGNDDSDD